MKYWYESYLRNLWMNFLNYNLFITPNSQYLYRLHCHSLKPYFAHTFHLFVSFFTLLFKKYFQKIFSTVSRMMYFLHNSNIWKTIFFTSRWDKLLIFWQKLCTMVTVLFACKVQNWELCLRNFWMQSQPRDW